MKDEIRSKLLNLVRNTKLYENLRIKYHKDFAYRSMNPKWDLKNKIVKINFEGETFIFKLTNEKNRFYSRPIYKCEPLGFLKNELKGYLKESPFKKIKGVCIDIGAYQGAFGIYSKKKIKGISEVLFFEPDLENIEILKENLKMNEIKTFKIINKGIWNKKESLNFESLGESGNLNPVGDKKVAVTDLDSELKRLKIPFNEVGFVKMDIEGAEIEAIEGMRELLTKGNPKIAIATYHWRDGKQTYKKVEKMLNKFGYKTRTGYQKHLTTWAWKD